MVTSSPVRIGLECDVCGQWSSTVVKRQHGSAECAPCYLASLEHGRTHVPESFAHTYIVVGYYGAQHVFTDAIEADSAADALAIADRLCGHVSDRFAVSYAPIPHAD